MKTLYKGVILGLSIMALASCKDDFLERTPKTIILEEQVWNDSKQILGLLANYYNRLPSEQSMDNWINMANYDDAMWSGYTGEDGRNNLTTYGTGSWYLWDYGLIRDINLALESIDKYSTKPSAAEKTQFKGELRFLRAFVYFNMVKRMGGVPLVTTQLIYDYSGDPSPLQTPRAKEAEVYDFIASEMDAIKNDLGNVSGSTPSNSRATKYTALALKSRAMLYAGSLGKYNAQLPSPITLPGGEVGIPAARANEYFQKSLDASKEIINSGLFTLYKGNTTNLGENFYEAITKKTGNKEMIFVKDYLTAKSKRHSFAYNNIPLGIREDNLGSSAITPSLNLVESFEFLDGTSGVLKNRNPSNTDYIYYDNPQDIFANKDTRLAGTVIYPGSTFKGLPVQIQAGVLVWNSANSTYTTVEGSSLGTSYTDGKLLTGTSGPHRTLQEVTNNGFYIRKFLDAGAGTSTRGIQTDIWWVWFRLGEVYLNAAEAALELNQTTDALTYINAIRQRAGFPANSLTAGTLTMDKIRNERKVELAFEDHRLWDLKRWRIAHTLWNGNPNSTDAMMYALYPYRIVRPGDAARDGKYVFVKLVAPRFRAPRFFQMFNYYTYINQTVIDNSGGKVIRNPFQ